jgi:hypothetical protein
MNKRSQAQLMEDKRVKRAARNLAQYLGDLHQNMTGFMVKNKRVRTRILADVTALLESLPERDRAGVSRAIAAETQRIFDAQGSPKVGVQDKCVGLQGGGVTVTEGSVTVKGCVMGTLATGPQGGGVEVSVKC